jgi:hypothetical protein
VKITFIMVFSGASFLALGKNGEGNGVKNGV